MNKYFNKYSLFITAILLVLTSAQFRYDKLNPIDIKHEDKLFNVLTSLGEPSPPHAKTYTSEQARMGEEIVKNGRTEKQNGRMSRYVSKHYTCISCHNLVQEDPDLRYSDPEARLPYVKGKGIPFLQGTTFKGIVNRESWYNDDYVKKYGDEKVGKAHKNLREATQLCAVECSQGRPMKDWELDAVLAYMWTLQFTIEDLKISDKVLEELNGDMLTNIEKIAKIKSYYLQASPAHFYDAPSNKYEGYPGLTGDPKTGKDLYEISCLYCHKNGGVSHYILDNGKLSFKDLKYYIPRNTHFSLYQIIPYGTYAIPGHKPYMPHYPLERMSMQQVEDLRAFIEQKAS